jgi:hypothetical protein
MTTLDILVTVVVIGGLLNIVGVVMILSKLYDMDKEIKKNSAMLKENDSNMGKVIKLIEILMKRTSLSFGGSN